MVRITIVPHSEGLEISTRGSTSDSDGDKKQGDEGVAQGQQHVQHLAGGAGLADNQASQKRSQSQRQADRLGHGSGSKSQSQHHQ